MRLFRNLNEFTKLDQPICMALGVFDGVHLGHREVIRAAVNGAREREGLAAVMTFHPHPAKILRPESAPRLLTTEQQDFELFSRLDVDVCLVLDFTPDFSRNTPGQFLELLAGNIPSLKQMVVGPDWHFGKGREGDFEFLKSWAASHGIEAIEVPPLQMDGDIVSSTMIRSLISKGEIAAANARLGRPYQIVGKVVHGKGLGSKIGFPTANLDVESELLPAAGVYATRVLIDGEVFTAGVNIGMRPTVEKKGGSGGLVVEAHLLDFHDDLYGHHLRLDFIKRIRSETKFPAVDDLKKQIERDLIQVRQFAWS
jgi:riboflavin kinase / FMN adenylyltransferase